MDTLKTTFNPEEKVWYGNDLKFQSNIPPNSTVGKYIFSSMKENPNQVCQISDSDGISLTMGEALTMGIRIAQHLKQIHLLNENDIVGIAATNTTHLLPVLIGCWLNCTPFHVISPVSERDEITHLFGITRPKVVFCDGNLYESVFESCASMKLNAQIITMKDHVEKKNVSKVEDLLLPTETESLFVPSDVSDGALKTSAILCSSGTTGPPKAVCYSNKKLLIKENLKCDDIVFSFSSMDWYTGLWLLVSSIKIGFTRIITDEKFTPELLLKLIEKYKISFSMISSHQLTQISKCSDLQHRDISSLKTLIYCGCPTATESLRQAQTYFKNSLLLNLYGTTEFGTIAIGISNHQPQLVGKLSPGIKVKIIDREGNSLGIGSTGEILAQHNEVWNGYYNNTQDTILMQDSKGWFHTGDLGYIDKEGFLYLVDRKKDTLKFRGTHYWPNKIEQIIAEMPDVLEVCVFGVFNADDMDRAAAAVKIKTGSFLHENDIIDYVKKKLPSHMHLHGGVYFTEYFPKTSSGKIKRNATKHFILNLETNGNC